MTVAFLRAIAVFAALSLTEQGPGLVSLEAGTVIDRSVTIRPGTYRLSASPDHARPVITIRGENITVDFNGAVLAGGPDGVAPDAYAGVGMLIEGGRRMTVRNAVHRGCRVGILAWRSPELRLSPNDLSYNCWHGVWGGYSFDSVWANNRFAKNTEGIISDDGVRVWMDGAMILDEWAPHESKMSRVPLRGGARRFKVEYYESTGFAELRFDIQRK